MSWFWPFKKKHRPARDGGTVAATVSSPVEDVASHVQVAQTDLAPKPLSVQEYVEGVLGRDLSDAERKALGREARLKVGDRVLTVNGKHRWTVFAVDEDYARVGIYMVDSLGREQVKHREPSALRLA